MLHIEIPPAEKLIRTILVYLAIAVLLRVFGRRELAQLNNFDLVVMLLLSNVVQNAVIGPDNSLVGGLLGAAVLLLANDVMVRLAAWRGGGFFEGNPITLASDGQYDLDRMRRLGLRRADVDVAIKRQGGNSVADTKDVTLEPGGAVVMRLRPEEVGASRRDIADLNARLDRIEQHLANLTQR